MNDQSHTENQGPRGQEHVYNEVFLFSASTLCCRAGTGGHILTGPINPRRPVLVKGRSETGTPSAVTGTVCQNREEGVRQQTTH